jgi:hypothetical protein
MKRSDAAEARILMVKRARQREKLASETDGKILQSEAKTGDRLEWLKQQVAKLDSRVTALEKKPKKPVVAEGGGDG